MSKADTMRTKNAAVETLTAPISASILSLLLALALALPAHAQQFPNKDTATNREDSVWGTPNSKSTVQFGTDGNGSETWGVTPEEKPEPRDWYKDIIITVEPQVKWPPSGSESTTSTTETTTTDPAGANTTESTTTTTTW